MKKITSFIIFTLIIMLLCVPFVGCDGGDDTSTASPTTETPTTESPTTGAPTTENPTTQTPSSGAPTVETPTTELPTTELPATEGPTTEAPSTEAPSTEAPTTEAPTTEAPTTEAPTTEAPTTAPDPNKPKYYTATVSENDKLEITPYTGTNQAPEGLEGIYYTCKTPGGVAVNDENACIWIKIVPTTTKYAVLGLNVKGDYTEVKMVEQDIYCISGVSSDLSVSVSLKGMPVSKDDLLLDYGYGFNDNGELIVKWAQHDSTPLRYVKITYTNGKATFEVQADASLGEVKISNLFPGMRYDFTMQAVAYNRLGKEVIFNASYMNSPRDVAFPRVEITTENLYIPTFDVVNRPAGNWGQGITNAYYEQCVMKIYNENNEVVFNSTSGLPTEDAYLGAKIKARGNTSASQAPNQKIPYKVKLGTKADLLEPLIGREDATKQYAHKDWLLLNYGEEGYRIGGEAIADAVGMEWTPDYCYVMLYVNGDYRGLYVLSESVSRGTGEGEEQWRVNVNKDGYLFECDAYWWNEDMYFDTPITSKTPMRFTFKHPDTDNFDEASPQYLYIKDYMTRFETALKKDDDSYLDYVDLESFAKWLLVSDYLCINDAGGANIFLYKKDATDDSKVFLGPTWDYDSWMANEQGLSVIRLSYGGSPFYIPYFVKKASFHNKYVELFNETKDNLDTYIDEAFKHVESEAYEQLLEYEYDRFGTRAKSPTIVKENFKSWLDRHVSWMETQFN